MLTNQTLVVLIETAKRAQKAGVLSLDEAVVVAQAVKEVNQAIELATAQIDEKNKEKEPIKQ